jgi:hypothetical protein
VYGPEKSKVYSRDVSELDFFNPITRIDNPVKNRLIAFIKINIYIFIGRRWTKIGGGQ